MLGMWATFALVSLVAGKPVLAAVLAGNWLLLLGGLYLHVSRVDNRTD
jgi:hypothetical protein